MQLNMLKGKIHRATVVQAELNYVGSITIDEKLMKAAGINEYEQVQIVDINNGARFVTYVIAGKEGSGMICLNGALMDPDEVKDNPPKVVFVDEENHIRRVTEYERHGALSDIDLDEV